jgi:PGF-CTERM protein
MRKNREICVIFLAVSLILFLMVPTSVTAADIGALPPSKHIRSYEQFIADNCYAGEYISVNAKIKEIRSVRPGDLTEYRIKLMSLNDTLYGRCISAKQGLVMVKNSWEHGIGDHFIIDKEIGFPLKEGDNIVIVGYAGWFRGMVRNMTVDGGGTIILLLREDEYNKRKGTIRCKTHEISPGLIAVGSYDLSKLEKNPNLLDRDRDNLISLVDPDPNKFNDISTLDTDGDGLSDDFDPCPYKSDCDDDELSDKEELYVWNTEPENPDTDGDGLSDGEEKRKYGTDPNKRDTDGDGLTDREEAKGLTAGRTGGWTDPLIRDSDGDGIPDGKDTEQENTAPRINIEKTVPIGDDDDLLEEGEKLKITYGAEDETGISLITLSVDGKEIDSHCPNERRCSYSVLTDSLSLGTHNIKVEATDLHKCPKTGDKIVSVRVDRTGPSVYFTSPQLTIGMGEEAIFTLTAVNPTEDSTMNVQLRLKPPSGVSVTGTFFVEYGAGVYGSDYVLNPGDVKSFSMRIQANEYGEYTPKSTPTPKTPGFEAVFAIAGLLAVAYLVLRRRK